jgi:KaiC/GvpD/RAD55 family RecA-like ATPase
MGAFVKAERKAAKLRLALAGPAGSGKTMIALRIAKGMAQELELRIGVIDTEKRSSELYADKNIKGALLPEGWTLEFEVLPFNPPYPPKKYVQGIKVAEQEGTGILIIDSISHEWFGEGGVLEMVDAFMAADKNKNSFTAWKKVTPEHTKFVEAILQSSCHIIATMRSKVAYEVVKDERTGRTRPEKVGMAPIQREGMDFEFTTVLDLTVEGHVAGASKDRTGLFDGAPQVLTEETGVELIKWLDGQD